MTRTPPLMPVSSRSSHGRGGPSERDKSSFHLQGDSMKKLFTLAVTMLLAGALSFAQADKTGSTDKKGGTTTTDSGAPKKGKAKSKKGSSKKSKKSSTTTTPAPK